MIDTYFRASYQERLVDPVIKRIYRSGVFPDMLTVLALLLGLAITPALFFGFSFLAFTLLLLSGYLDTLDGSLARMLGKPSPRGAVLDIVSDRCVEFAVVLGICLVDPDIRALPCLCMTGAILLCVTSFLVVGIFTENQSLKGFHYSPGIMERGEAFAFLGGMILFPSAFEVLSALFTLLVTLTAIVRVKEFYTAT